MIGDRLAHAADAAQEQIVLDAILKTLSDQDGGRRGATRAGRAECLGSRVRITARRSRDGAIFEVSGGAVDAAGVARAIESLSAIFDRDADR